MRKQSRQKLAVSGKLRKRKKKAPRLSSSEKENQIIEGILKEWPGLLSRTRDRVRAIARSKKITFLQKIERLRSALEKDPAYNGGKA